MKKAILAVLVVMAAGCQAAPWKDPMIKPGAVPLADQVQKLTDVQICQNLGIAQARHDKAAYNVYSDELTQRERGKTFTLDQGACTALAVAEINKRNGSK